MSYDEMMMAPEYYTFTGREVIPDHVTHVLIDKALKFVPARAFYCHPSIQEVICHDGVEKIERDALFCCFSLRRVIMPGVKIIEHSAFIGCEALEYVECGKLEIIRSDAFRCCQSLRSINLPSARIIGEDSFGLCKALVDVKFGCMLETIGEGAFRCKHSLKRITTPLKNGLFTSDDIFQTCENLNQVDLVEAVELHEIVAALQLEEWRNDMNEVINSINQILPDASAGYYDSREGEDYPGEKARVIRQWISTVLGKIIRYQAEHQRILDASATILHFALPHDIVMNSILPFLELPPHTFEEEDEDEEESDNAAAAEYNLEALPFLLMGRRLGAIAARERAGAIRENELLNIGSMPVIDEEEEEEAEQGIIARDERTPIIPVESTSFTSPVGASPSVDPPSSNAPVVAKTKVEEKRVEESTLFEADEEDIPQISPLWKVFNGIFMLMKWASILPLALGVIYILVV